MPIYEYRCRACGDTMEQLRALSQADDPVACGCGVTDTVRLPSLVARNHTSAGGDLPMAGGAPGGGGCCGGGCCG